MEVVVVGVEVGVVEKDDVVARRIWRRAGRMSQWGGCGGGLGGLRGEEDDDCGRERSAARGRAGEWVHTYNTSILFLCGVKRPVT